MAADTIKQIRRKLNDAPDVKRLAGTFVSTDGVRAVVDVGGGRIPADLTGYLPEVNEDVWVLFINGVALVLGPTTPRPGKGTVTGAPSGNLVPVSTIAGNFTLPYAAGLSLSSGQVVKIAWNDGGFVTDVMSISPPPGTAPGAPGTGGTDQIQVFTAIDAGSYDGRWWTAQVWSSDSNIGAWFYGTKIADTIPDTAAIISVEIYISPVQILYAPPNIGVHGSAGKPSGAVAVSSATPIGVAAGWIGLPPSFGDYLKANYGGIGIAHGGYSIFNSLAADAQSGALRIHWR